MLLQPFLSANVGFLERDILITSANFNESQSEKSIYTLKAGTL